MERGKAAVAVFICVVVFVVGVGVGAAAAILLSDDCASPDTTPQDTAGDSHDGGDEVRTYTLDREVSVYLPWWDQQSGFDSIQDHADLISAVHPFWYQLNADGSIGAFQGAENSTVIEYCLDSGILLLPVISNEQDAAIVHTVLGDETLRTQHVAAIAALIDENQYDGVNIDYENLDEADRELYSQFLRELSTEIHQNGKLLYVSVHAKTSDAGTWNGPAAQDWDVIGEVSDRVKIMAYDYHWSTSEAGDIAPLSWIEDVLAYAVTIIDPAKIHLGIHFYGYDWVGMESESLTYEDVTELISDNGIEDISTSLEGEKYFSYSSDGEDHIVYFADGDVVGQRVALADEYDLTGIAIWRVGGEDEGDWVAIEELFRGE